MKPGQTENLFLRAIARMHSERDLLNIVPAPGVPGCLAVELRDRTCKMAWSNLEVWERATINPALPLEERKLAEEVVAAIQQVNFDSHLVILGLYRCNLGESTTLFEATRPAKEKPPSTVAELLRKQKGRGFG
jgi:hypothetical protein